MPGRDRARSPVRRRPPPAPGSPLPVVTDQVVRAVGEQVAGEPLPERAGRRTLAGHRRHRAARRPGPARPRSAGSRTSPRWPGRRRGCSRRSVASRRDRPSQRRRAPGASGAPRRPPSGPPELAEGLLERRPRAGAASAPRARGQAHRRLRATARRGRARANAGTAARSVRRRRRRRAAARTSDSRSAGNSLMRRPLLYRSAATSRARGSPAGGSRSR